VRHTPEALKDAPEDASKHCATSEDLFLQNAGFGTTAGPKSEMATTRPSGAASTDRRGG
jgi:limonene-1,2-epoxide hydrolase